MPSSPSRRRPGIQPSDASIAKVAFGVLGLLLVVGIALLGGSFLTGEDPAPAPPATASPTTLPTTAVTSTRAPRPSASASPTKKRTRKPNATTMTAFVRGYLGTVTADPATGWQRLTPGFRSSSGGFPSYLRFWSGISRATARDIVADPDALTVGYDVDYTHRDGSHSSDSTRLGLTFRHGRYLIDGEG